MRRYDSPVLTVKEVADYLQVHQSTIYRLLKRNMLPAFRIGSDWRFRKADLDEWLQRLGRSSGKVDT
jgi:excisionase family DNA binding protein